MREIYMCSKHIEETYKKKPEPIKKEAKINNDFDEKKNTLFYNKCDKISYY